MDAMPALAQPIGRERAAWRARLLRRIIKIFRRWRRVSPADAAADEEKKKKGRKSGYLLAAWLAPRQHRGIGAGGDNVENVGVMRDWQSVARRRQRCGASLNIWRATSRHLRDTGHQHGIGMRRQKKAGARASLSLSNVCLLWFLL
jgi:hypothetical protein